MSKARTRSSATGARSDGRLPSAATILLVGWATLLLLAPPAAPSFWAVNGLRSLPPTAALGLLLAAGLAAAIPAARARGVPLAWGGAIALAALTAFPLREQTHVLGDTQLRLRAIEAASLDVYPAFGSWWARLHAHPLDVAVNVMLPLLLQRLGLSLRDAISSVSFALALAWLAAWWRLAGRLRVAEELRGALTLALALSGVLQAFAGYAEVAGLMAAAAAWWWAELIAPLSTRTQAWRTAAAFAVLLLGHRAGLVMLLPQMWRALGPAARDDRPEARRALAALTLIVLALVAVSALPMGAGRQLGADARELLRSLELWPSRLADFANTLALVAPLAPFAAVAGRGALAVWIREPGFAWVATAAIPLLLALAWVFPVGDSGLGAMRDWDANVLLGAALTAGAGMLLATLPTARLRATLTAALPLLVVGALGWVAVNADSEAATRRALALTGDASPLTRPQKAHLHAYFGQRGMNERRPDLAARHFEVAFELGGNARRALLAAEAWLVAGDAVGARRMLARARSGAPLSPELERSAAELEARAGGR